MSARFIRQNLLIVWVLVSLLTISGEAQVVTPKAYRERVNRATFLLDALQVEDEPLAPKERINTEREILREVRLLVPPTARVEIAGQTIETDNAWLALNLKNYESLPVDAPARRELLRQTVERLAALEARLTELEGATGANATGKNDDKQRLSEILRRQEFQPPEPAEPSIVERWLRDFQEWLSSLFRPGRPPEIAAPKTESAPLAAVLRYAVIALATLVTVFIVWRFALPLLGRNRTFKKGRKPKSRVILGERIAADRTAADLFGEAELLARQGELRPAIRKGYIALLCELGDRKVVRLSDHKTNRDYLRDVRERESLHDQMRGLTTSFERHWYGFVPANTADWEQFRDVYRTTVQSLASK